MTIWVIDDDRAICDLVTKTLEGLGCDAKAFSDPSEIDDWDGAPDGLVIDWHLTGGTAEGAIADLHQRFPHIKLMLITSDSDLDVLQRALNLGITGWWFKPSGPVNLRTQLYNTFNLSMRQSA